MSSCVSVSTQVYVNARACGLQCGLVFAGTIEHQPVAQQFPATAPEGKL